MKEAEIILSLCSAIFGLVVTVLTFLVKLIKNTKARKVAEQILKISSAIIPYIKEAEKFTSYSGQQKKNYVMDKATQFALDNQLPFSKEDISTKIEELVNLTKQVNIKNREKIESSISDESKTTDS